MGDDKVKCGHAAFVIPREIGITIDISRDWGIMQKYLRHCVLLKDHDGCHEYGDIII
jgi:hypothetical protein